MTICNLFAEIAERSPGFRRDSIKLFAPKPSDEIFDKHTRIFARRKGVVKGGLSAAHIPVRDTVGLNRGMDKHQCRKQWLRDLLKKENSVAALALKLQTDPNYISSLLGPSSDRNIGDELARRVEQVYRLPTGVMDMPSSGALKLAEAAEGMDDDQIKKTLEFMRFVKSSKN